MQIGCRKYWELSCASALCRHSYIQILKPQHIHTKQCLKKTNYAKVLKLKFVYLFKSFTVNSPGRFFRNVWAATLFIHMWVNCNIYIHMWVNCNMYIHMWVNCNMYLHAYVSEF
jgi:hypothetical protein